MSVVKFGRVNLIKVGLLAIAVTLAACLVALVGTTRPAVATFPGSNGKIVFSASGVGGSRDIYVANADGTSKVNLTNSPQNEARPDWSPDSQKIAFMRSNGSEWDIFSMNTDGTGVTGLATSTVCEMDPAWSPDGQKIAFSRDCANPRIYVMNTDGTNQIPLTQQGFDGDPDWSPEGQKIAFSRAAYIYVMNADGTNQVRLTSGSDIDQSPSWSPDGERIAFQRNSGEVQSEIYVVNADGTGGLANVTNNPAQDLSPSWSPEGQKIAFASNRVTGGHFLFVMNADGTNPLQLTSFPPDGVSEIDWGTDSVIEDSAAPTLSVPADITKEATGASGTTVDYTASAIDEVDGSVSVSCSPASGSTFSIGTTPVNCSATDQAGNQATGSFNVTVIYNFGSGGGFAEPVRDTELNQVNAGAGVPVKFGLGADYGLNIFAVGYPVSKKIDCSTGLPTDPVEETVAVTKSGLSYDATSSLYTYVWKTEKAWKGTCRELNMKLADDTDHRVRFQFE